MGLLTQCCVLLAAVLHHCAGEVGVLIPLDDDAKKECVDKHNDLRRSEDASDMSKMVWNEEAEKTAGFWAQMCLWQHSHDYQRRISTSNCGENLFWSISPFKLPEAVQVWHSEKEYYKYGVGSTVEGADIGHYTQVMWSSSSQLGCAMAKCEWFYIAVCHYCPRGNVYLHLPYAKGRACSKCPEHCENGLCTNTCVYGDDYSDCEIADCGEYAEKCRATCKCN